MDRKTSRNFCKGKGRLRKFCDEKRGKPKFPSGVRKSTRHSVFITKKHLEKTGREKKKKIFQKICVRAVKPTNKEESLSVVFFLSFLSKRGGVKKRRFPAGGNKRARLFATKIQKSATLGGQNHRRVSGGNLTLIASWAQASTKKPIVWTIVVKQGNEHRSLQIENGEYLKKKN